MYVEEVIVNLRMERVGQTRLGDNSAPAIVKISSAHASPIAGEGQGEDDKDSFSVFRSELRYA
jgi:hypothetical protein